MKFDISNIRTVYENCQGGDPNLNLDCTINDTSEFNEEIVPVSKVVFTSMKKSASDPKNVNVTVEQTNEATKVYVEAVEFMLFCEAAELNVFEASEAIVNSYADDVPQLNNAEFHVVFPSDCLNKNVLGGQGMGKNVSGDWAMRLMSGCRRYGLKINAGVDNTSEPVIKRETLDEEDPNR